MQLYFILAALNPFPPRGSPLTTKLNNLAVIRQSKFKRGHGFGQSGSQRFKLSARRNFKSEPVINEDSSNLSDITLKKRLSHLYKRHVSNLCKIILYYNYDLKQMP